MSTANELLAKLGLTKPLDFLLHLPLRYVDLTRVTPIGDLHDQDEALVEGEVTRCDVIPRPRRSLVVELDDGSGQLQLRYFHFFPSMLKQFSVGQTVRVFGSVKGSGFGAGYSLAMFHPSFSGRVSSEETDLPATLTPIYPSTQGLSQGALRKAIAKAIEPIQANGAELADHIDASALTAVRAASSEQFSLYEALRFIHHPPAGTDESSLHQKSHPAWQRVILDELVSQQLSLLQARQMRETLQAKPLTSLSIAKAFCIELERTGGIRLTNAQQRVFAEIQRDLSSGVPMNRLLQGDVGSGKTIVAALACLMAVSHSKQAAFMAPTEILAEQHFRKLKAWLEPLGVRVGWLTGSLKAKEKLATKQAIAKADIDIAVGTHALIEPDVEFKDLALVVADEQHRFGVKQRLALRRVETVHQLMMSATPIPRTLAMTYYADLDVSTIDELPPGRTPVVTKLIDEQRRDEVLARVEHAVSLGQQVYWVCPLIEESEALQLKTAQETFDTLKLALPSINVGLVHGRLSSVEKEASMQAFMANHVQLLVATTVIEVGVDVPNASLMVIEHAERFGLSQLHQLRGRVGRGAANSVCILLYRSPLSLTAKERLRIMYQTTDGFEIARRDLELRGPGEFLGARQSGDSMLRFADINRDAALVAVAKAAAERMIENPEAKPSIHAQIQRWLSWKAAFLKA